MALPVMSFPIAHSPHCICWAAPLAFMKALICDDIHQHLQPPQDFLNTSCNIQVKCRRLTSPCLPLNTLAGAPWVVEFAVGGWSQSWGVDGEAGQTCALGPACGEEETSKWVNHARGTGIHSSCSEPVSINQGKTQMIGLVNVCPREKSLGKCQGWWEKEPRVMSFTCGHHRHNTDLPSHPLWHPHILTLHEILFGGNMKRKRGNQATSSLEVFCYLHCFLFLHCQPHKRNTRQNVSLVQTLSIIIKKLQVVLSPHAVHKLLGNLIHNRITQE